MTKATIRSNLTDLIPDIAATHGKGLDYVLGETNSYSCHVSERQRYDLIVRLPCYLCMQGAPGVSNTAGSALWTLDYLLFAYVDILRPRIF